MGRFSCFGTNFCRVCCFVAEYFGGG
jgi:hypothetical protein